MVGMEIPMLVVMIVMILQIRFIPMWMKSVMISTTTVIASSILMPLTNQIGISMLTMTVKETHSFQVEQCEKPDGDWVTIANDCDDDNPIVYNDAPELCDGIQNDCASSGIPLDEVDNDGDGFVECDVDLENWNGNSDVIGGRDCNDENLSMFPTATEFCDSIFNDCDNPLHPQNINGDLPYPTVTKFEKIDETGTVGDALDCFCSTTDCLIDTDSDGVSDCKNSVGDTCTPVDLNLDGYADTCEGGIFAGVVGDCFCDDNCENCFDSFGNECSQDAHDICLHDLEDLGIAIETPTIKCLGGLCVSRFRL